MSLNFMGLLGNPGEDEYKICDSPNYKLLETKLLQMGLSKAQVNCKATEATFVVCANNPEVTELYEVEKRIEKAKRELDNIRYDASNEEQRLRSLKSRYQAQECRAQEIQEETNKYIDEFNDALKNCETAEGRDTLRLAQMFVNSVDIESVQNNTAYINGLACILSGGKCGSMFNGFKKLEKQEE
jgi:chromosome segregation ATPase